MIDVPSTWLLDMLATVHGGSGMIKLGQVPGSRETSCISRENEKLLVFAHYQVLRSINLAI